MKKLGIGMAGFGYMGKIHLLSYRDIPLVYPGTLPEIEMKGVFRSTMEKAQGTAGEFHFSEGYDDYESMLRNDSINVIDIVTPNYLHKEMIIKAFRAGKSVLCEKPLALNFEETAEIVSASRESGVKLGMIFNYRFIPAVQKARELIAGGRLGEIYGFRGEYFHTGYQNPERPFTWRMDAGKSGGGALADMGIHVIDLLRFLLGDFSSVQVNLKTFIKKRPLPDGSGETAEVTVDDAAWVNAELESGAAGTIEISRFATGSLDDLNISAFGEKGAFRFSLMDPNFLYWFDNSDKSRGWQRLETLQNYEGTSFPSPRSVIGWTRFHLENQYRFLKAVSDGAEPVPGLDDGVEAQKVLSAAYESGKTGSRVII